MADKPGVWCSKCRTVHKDEPCPHRKPFERKRAKQKSGRGGRPWQRKRERIFRRDRFLCQICLEQGVLTSVELHGPNHGVLDHKIPTAEGGDDTDANLQTICQQCDKEKTQEESKRYLTQGGV